MLATWDAVSRLDRMFDAVMGSMLGTAIDSRSFQPAVDVRSSDEALIFACDVPGVRLEDLEIVLESGVLTVKGTRRYENHAGEQVLLGRSDGAFTRSFALPDYVDSDKLTANLADGVLTITVPKQAAAKPRRIQIGKPSENKQLTE